MSVRATLDRAISAFTAKDAQAFCELTSPKADDMIGRAAHSTPTTCERDVRRYFKWIRPHQNGAVEVARVSRFGNRTVAVVAIPGGRSVTVPFVKEEGSWRLDGVFDAPVSRIQVRGDDRLERPLLAPAGSVPRTTRSVNQVRVTDPQRPGSCPPLSTRRFPEITGGCVLDVAGERLQISAQSAFGTLPFARCDVSLDMRIDARGRTWIADMTIDGANVCFDAMPCLDTDKEKVPWSASIVRTRGGKVSVRIEEACLDTCLGRFEGSWQLPLAKSRHGWTVVARDSIVGRSGWTFDGSMRSTGGKIAVGS